MENFFSHLEMYFQGSILLAVLAAYSGGILASFTPCIYPIIPITIAYIGAHGSRSKQKGFLLSVIYVSGMASVYTVMGCIAALTGMLFGRIQTNPWLHIVIANICIFMGLSMLGVFSVAFRPPGFIARSHITDLRKGLISSFFVGAMSGLIVGPCTTPILAVLLSLIASKQNIILGVLLMFFFAFGMGTLLIVLGTFTTLLASIPKSGVWMTKINKFFGILLLGIGEYFLVKAGFLWI